MERFRLLSTLNLFGGVDLDHGGGFLRGGLAVLLAGIMVLAPALSQAQDIDQSELKRAFFMDLSDDQKVSLLEELDQSSQLTSVQLGAKYNWGYIPPDRRPPVSLARWWDNLNNRERRRERIEWFNNHYKQLNLQRAARELGQRDRLSELYRQLEGGDDAGGMNFEAVSFPRGNLKLDTAQRNTLPEGYERFQYDDNGPESPVESPDDGTSSPSDPGDREAETSSAPSEQTTDVSSRTTQEDTESTEKQSRPQSESTEEDDRDTSTEWRRERHFDGGTVIFQRVGDEIKATRRSSPDTFLETEPDYDYPVRSTGDDRDEFPMPPLRFEDKVTSPQLRFYQSRSGDGSPSPSVR